MDYAKQILLFAGNAFKGAKAEKVSRLIRKPDAVWKMKRRRLNIEPTPQGDGRMRRTLKADDKHYHDVMGPGHMTSRNMYEKPSDMPKGAFQAHAHYVDAEMRIAKTNDHDHLFEVCPELKGQVVNNE